LLAAFIHGGRCGAAWDWNQPLRQEKSRRLSAGGVRWRAAWIRPLAPDASPEGARLGEPVPRAVIDKATASVGIPRQPDSDTGEEVDILRKRLEDLRQQITTASHMVRDGARQVVRQTEVG